MPLFCCAFLNILTKVKKNLFYLIDWTFKIVFCQFPLKIMKEIPNMNYTTKIISVERIYPVKSWDKWRVHLGRNLISRLKKRIYLGLLLYPSGYKLFFLNIYFIKCYLPSQIKQLPIKNNV